MEEFKLTFESDNPSQTAIAFKNFAEQEQASGIESLEVEQAAGKQGDQGLGHFLGSVITKISGSDSAIKSITDLITRFMELFEGHIIIKDGKGGEIRIPGGRKLTPEQKTQIALSFTANK